jgi:flagellar motor protein MotB
MEQEEAGEGYFASISDLMVGILFIFLLMLAVFAINYASEDKDQRIRDLEKQVAELTAQLRDKDREILRLSNAVEELKVERDRLRNGLAELIKQLEGVTFSLQGAQGRPERIRQDLLLTLKSDLDKRGVDVDIESAPGILRLSCTTHQPIFETILIEGHTDTRPTDRRGGNWTLSTDRARAFLELMVGPALVLRDLRNASGQPMLGLAGYGDSRPRAGIEGADARNRRIEVRFILSGQQESLSANIVRLDDALKELRSLVGQRP